jgi:lipid-binding SYLF domain-containing protein
MKTHHAVSLVIVTLVVGVTLSGRALAGDPVADARATLATFIRKDPGLKRFVERSAGYAVFPSISKAAVGVGGAHGSGILFDQSGQPVAVAKMTQVTVGLQLGAQGYSEVIFFETPKAYADFRAGRFTMAAQVSAVALAAGAAEAARYESGVAVFTATNAGLMFEASVGGQKFSTQPLKK